jgi:hypothetical protein
MNILCREVRPSSYFKRRCQQRSSRLLQSSTANFLGRLAALFLIGSRLIADAAELNSWTKPTSGNWEEPQWSLGVLPGADQSIMITNQGWKAVAIGPNAALNFPQSLNVSSVTVASPTNSFNTLLLNYAGLQTPLTVNSLTVASNSALTMFSSALRLNGPTGVGMSVGGEFNQSDSSVVTGNQLDIGYIGPGVYNFDSGLLAVGHIWVGGQYGGIFNHHGGANDGGIVHLESGGIYNLLGGEFSPDDVYFNGGTFRQRGARLHGLTIFQGVYLLENGVNEGDLLIPISAGGCGACGSASVVQSGGTNFGNIRVGTFGPGSYGLSNGLFVGGMFIDARGSYQQSGGVQVATNTVVINEDWVARQTFGWGSYALSGGMASAPEMLLEGTYTQAGGTNILGGDLTMSATHASFSQSGGTFRANNANIYPSWVGGFSQSAGTLIVTNQLWVCGTDSFFSWRGLSVSGGQLIVSNIALCRGVKFSISQQTVTQSGLLILGTGKLIPGTGSHQFGSLKLDAESSWTNSFLTLTQGAPSVVRFRASSAVPWTNTATLTIEDWEGSVFGGGTHQIIFGNDANALTSQQLSQIYFRDPLGLSPGLYGATILSSGEIVPNSLPPTGREPPTIRITRQSDLTMRVTVLGEAGSDYAIEISTNLVNWNSWTNFVATNGTFSVIDGAVSNDPHKFYRAFLRP